MRWTFVGKVMSLLFNMLSRLVMGFPGSSEVKASAWNAGDPGSIPGSGRSPGEGNVWLVITFLPRSKHLLISWLQSPSAVILELKKINCDTVSTVSPSISHEVMGPDAMIFVF